MSRRVLSLLVILLFPYSVFGQDVFILNEESIKKIYPSLDNELAKIAVNKLSNESEYLKLNNSYATVIYGESSYTKTNEAPLTNFSPIFSPSKQLSIGLKKKLKLGAKLDVQAGFLEDEFSINSSLNEVSTSFAKMSLSLELIKDFLGNSSRAELHSLKLMDQRANLQYEIQAHGVYVELRRIYWDLFALEQAKMITGELYEMSKRQVKDVLKRQKQSIADKTEVAGYKTQKLNRKSSLIDLEYKRQLIHERLFKLFPNLKGKKIVISPMDINKVTRNVLVCTDYIQKLESFPEENTPIDEMVNMTLQQLTQENIKVSKQDKPSLELFTSLQTLGRSQSINDSIDDNLDNDRTGVNVGIRFNYAFGKKSERKVNQRLTQLRYQSQAKDIKNQAHAFHEKVSKSFKYLEEIINNQQESSQVLRNRLVGMRKKYRQARISVNDLITDQDNLLQSELTVIETKRAVLNMLLDYFKIFPQTPCDFNLKI